MSINSATQPMAVKPTEAWPLLGRGYLALGFRGL